MNAASGEQWSAAAPHGSAQCPTLRLAQRTTRARHEHKVVSSCGNFIQCINRDAREIRAVRRVEHAHTVRVHGLHGSAHAHCRTVVVAHIKSNWEGCHWRARVHPATSRTAARGGLRARGPRAHLRERVKCNNVRALCCEVIPGSNCTKRALACQRVRPGQGCREADDHCVRTRGVGELKACDSGGNEENASTHGQPARRHPATRGSMLRMHHEYRA